jgi:hypothetical protein
MSSIVALVTSYLKLPSLAYSASASAILANEALIKGSFEPLITLEYLSV